MGIGFPEALIIFFGIAFLIFDILMIIDAVNNKSLSTLAKVLWIAGIIFFSPLGAAIYLFTARSSTVK